MPSANYSEKKPIPYKGFPSFGEWIICAADTERWEQAMTALKEEPCFDILRRIRLVIKNAAFACRDKTKNHSKETDNNLLFKSMCESLTTDMSIDANLALETQLTVYDYLMNFAEKKNKNISKSWLCRLHSLICGVGQNHAGSKAVCRFHIGKYKDLPNKIKWEEGKDIFGAPVKRTSAEMLEYFRELRSKAFLQAHPVLQASYAHYALVAIHPFANGNGRVARLLAFIFMYRSNFVPALSLNQDRIKYTCALRAADMGNFQPFISLVQEKSIESANQIKERIRSAMRQI